MARNISAASLAKLATNHGTEPINIIEIIWTENGQRDGYSDRDIVEGSQRVKGKILQINGLDEVIQVSNGAASAEIEIVLDDSDGSIKNILDNNDIHKRPAYVYQWFDGILLSEKFLLFQGEISSPISWKEGDRTVTLTIISKLEDKEIGFSPEEGEFDFIPKNLIGKPWPMAFGTVLDIPAVQIQESKVGTLAEGTGCHDFTIPYQISCLDTQADFLASLGIAYAISAGFQKFIGNEQGYEQLIAQSNALLVQAGQLRDQIEELQAALTEQKTYETDSIRIIGGAEFPQGVHLELNVNDAILSGVFIGDTFHIGGRQHPEYPNFCISGNTTVGCKAVPHIEGTITGTQQGGDSFTVPGDRIEGDSAGFFWAEAGSRAVIAGGEPIDFVVSIVPGTVLRVSAKRAFEGVKRLIVVPPSYYTVSTRTYGSISAVMVTLNKPLSNYADEGWEDDIYVTFQSSVGPNTVSIISYLLSLYAPHLTPDSASFASVTTKLENYPSNFALFERRNIIDVLQDIAFQARCALWVSNDTVYIRYLPEEPTAVTTMNEDDIETDSGNHSSTLEVFTTDTEDLVTKYTGTWQESYAVDEPNKIILRHNVKKYGTIEETYDYFIYNNQDLVLKSMTFWLIRKANTWKKVRFRTTLHKLVAETMDAVELDFTGTYIANQAVKGLVEKATYDSASRTIDFEIWTPVKAGTMVPYDFAWPAAISQQLLFPTIEEEFAGLAGGDGPGKDAQGTLPIDRVGTQYTIADENGRRDRGDRRPSDVGDIKPDPPYRPIDTGPQQGNPGIDTPRYQQLPPLPTSNLSYIDLRTTVIFDSETQGSATLDSFFKRIDKGTQKLQMDATAIVADDDNAGPFAFVWDEDVFGTDRAFLKDD